MKFFKPSNSNEETPKINKSRIPNRLNVLFFVAFLLFALLIGRLVQLQIIQGNHFQSEIDSGDIKTETRNVQRGMIYDSAGKPLVANNSSRAISYSKPLNVYPKTMYSVANDLVKYVDIDSEPTTKTMRANYYLAKNEDAVKKKIPGSSKITDVKKLTQLEIKYVNDHGLTDGMTAAQKKAVVVFTKMNNAYALSTIYLKTKNVSDQEMSQVGEHQSDLPGIKITTDWTRTYPNGNSIKNVAGTLTSQKQGLPSERINELLAEGYERDDSVGSSYIESQYEDVLKGTKKAINVETQNGKITKRVKQYGGKVGDNVQLTINSKFQNDVQKIVENAVKTGSANGNPLMTGGYAVAMNPQTGGIYALAGVDRDNKTGKITTDSLGPINQTMVMGSVVKGAQVMGGLRSGVITPTNNTLTDTPIKLAGTATIASIFNKTGNNNMTLSAADALEVSSNSYMMQLTMKEAGFNYTSGAALNMPTSIFDKLRSNFNQYGLGVKTGIDIPGEAPGFKGGSSQAEIGKALNLSFGNYDAYTTIQVAQYMSTIANGGYRMQPHVLQSIRGHGTDDKLGAVKYEFQPKILNVVEGTAAQWKVVHQGLWQVVHGSNQWRTGARLASLKPAVAAKSGTAETTTNGSSTTTLSAASYAPTTNPQIVIAVAYPGSGSTNEGFNMESVKSIYQAFWKDVKSSDGLN
ncbi:penicillin-binding protein 2B [Ligilactobacillus salitolerans]|uniref:Penicillin-binding protein 2B n=1 Tax=Ligilactobacillus salitolerans TaxID=1808352 RepID=A0A401ISB8_9LACO|nr:penicillin-binding protein 2 [Ligilactobacillus salitolerans]GBG94433.1 penicillin-binding protein 2B [Ligilactobacillus salitolerans]